MAINKRSRFIILGILILAIIVLAGIFVWPFNLGQKMFAPSTDWFAVHLTNGVVYVGQIKSVNSGTVVLNKAYYMQSYGAAQNNEGQPAQFYGLVKQGSEAPLLTDQVISINRPVILFWEKLDPASDVVDKLNEHN